MSEKTLKAYVGEITPFDSTFSQVVGKPQKFSVVGDRIYWTQGMQQKLYSLPTDDLTATPVEVVGADMEGDPNRPISKEEELIRERMRRTSTGISSYRIRKSDAAVFYVVGVDFYAYFPSAKTVPQRGPYKVFDFLRGEDRVLYPSLLEKPNIYIEYVELPTAEDTRNINNNVNTTITFVNDSNVYIAFIEERLDSDDNPLEVAVEQVTRTGDPLRQFGVADYIIQEEFDRYTGHYSSSQYIVFSYTDETQLREVALLAGNAEAEVESMRYARVGDPNPRSLLVVYDRQTRAMHVVPHSAVLKAAPWAEYVPRFGFKNHNTIYFSVLSRTQETYAVFSCSISELPVVREDDLRSFMDCKADAVDVPLTKEWSQNISWAWVDVPAGPPIIFGATHDVLLCHDTVSETAHCHLFIRPAGASAEAWRPLTSGAWNVRPGTVSFSSDNVVFIANAEARLRSALYSVPLPKEDDKAVEKPFTADQLTRLTPADQHIHLYYATENLVCYVASSPTQPPDLYIMALSHEKISDDRTVVNVVPWVVAPKKLPEPLPSSSGKVVSFVGLDIVVPTVITVTNRRGVPLSAQIFPSPLAPAGKPGPLALFVYGGPHAQLVHENDFEAACRTLVQVLVRQCISVAVVDNQMSNANGLRDLSICKKNMGNFETEDYVDVVKYLCSSPSGAVLPPDFAVDPSRIAIFGWSYGGYTTLLAMCQAPDVFQIGFAGAPVGDWRLYDTGYTERYMGTLLDEANEPNKAYETSSIRHFAPGFPEERDRLFIAHGLLDENVHLGHSSHVVSALVDNVKPYSMLLYPGERHGLRQKKASRHHHDAYLLKTLSEHL